MIKFEFEANMNKMPENCVVCTVDWCPLPFMRYEDRIMKKCQTKRHKECPLVEYKDEEE